MENRILTYIPTPAFVVATANQIIIQVNEKAIAFTGWTYEELIGKNYTKIFELCPLEFGDYDNIEINIKNNKLVNVHISIQAINEKDNKYSIISFWEAAQKIITESENSNDDQQQIIGTSEIAQLIETKKELIENEKKLELFFKQSLTGFFFMMLDEAVVWNDLVDKEKVLDYVFDHQRITKINEAMLQQYGAQEKDLLGSTPKELFAHDIDYGRAVWKDFFDKGHLHVDTKEQKLDGTPVDIEGDYICLYDDKGRITGHFGIQMDVSRQKETQKTLQNSEDLYRKLFDSSKDAIMTLAPPQWNFTSGNQAIFEMFLVENKEEFISLKPWEISPEKQNDGSLSMEKAQKMIQTAMDKGSHFFEWTHKRKNGESFPCTVFLNRIDWSDGSFLQATVKDISEQKYLEEKRVESETKYRTLVEASRDSIFIMQNGIIKYTNTELTRLSGYSMDEIIEKPFINFIATDEIKKVREYYKNRLKGVNVPTSYELIARQKSGKFIPVEVTVIIIDFEGKPAEMVVLKDISAHKRSESIQRVLLEITEISFNDINLEEYLSKIHNLLGQLFIVDNLYIALYNKIHDKYTFPYYVDEFDHISKDELHNMNNTLTNHILKTGKGQLITEEIEKELFGKEKELVVVGEYSQVWVGAPLVDSSTNEVIGVIAIQDYKNKDAYTQDDLLTLEIIANNIGLFIERVKSTQELKLAKEKAEESDRLKSTFLATMSHELRTPLNAIIGFSDIIDSDDSLEDINGYLQIINRSGNHLLGLVNDIFDITLIDAGEIHFHYEQYPMSTIFSDVESIIGNEQILLEKSNVSLQVQLPEENSALIISTDPKRLKQVLLNLLKNALKFTNQGSINYGYSRKNINGESFLQFFVKDTGIGIAKDKQEIVFDIFRQADDSHTRKHDGVGIGLAISQKIINLMGGKIWLESTEGSGTSFYFILPVAEKDEEETGALKQTDLIKDFSDKCILIAEDHETNYKLLQIMLRHLKSKILWAKDGLEALEMCQKDETIDLVLMDIRMPKMNGLEATIAIKKIRPNLPIVAQTAYAILEDREKALEIGCDDFLTKPLSKILLIEKINKYLKSD